MIRVTYRMNITKKSGALDWGVGGSPDVVSYLKQCLCCMSLTLRKCPHPLSHATYDFKPYVARRIFRNNPVECPLDPHVTCQIYKKHNCNQTFESRITLVWYISQKPVTKDVVSCILGHKKMKYLSNFSLKSNTIYKGDFEENTGFTREGGTFGSP